LTLSEVTLSCAATGTEDLLTPDSEPIRWGSRQPAYAAWSSEESEMRRDLRAIDLCLCFFLTIFGLV